MFYLRRLVMAIVFAASLLTIAVYGQTPGTIPPELIMSHQNELKLQDAQRTKLIAETSQAQAKFTEVQWTMGAEQQKLEQLLSQPAIDEAAAMRQLERIMSIEQDLKRSQMTLLIRVKNTLTPAQLEMAEGMRGQVCAPSGGR